MSLSKFIRKTYAESVSTAIHATSATQPNLGAGSVARIATVAVAVANRPERKRAAMTTQEESAVMSWLASIEESDTQMIQAVLTKCQEEPEALAYFLWRTTGGNA